MHTFYYEDDESSYEVTSETVRTIDQDESHIGLLPTLLGCLVFLITLVIGLLIIFFDETGTWKAAVTIGLGAVFLIGWVAMRGNVRMDQFLKRHRRKKQTATMDVIIDDVNYYKKHQFDENFVTIYSVDCTAKSGRELRFFIHHSFANRFKRKVGKPYQLKVEIDYLDNKIEKIYYSVG